MRVAESAERRRFCGCERSRGHQKPPCTVKRQPPEGGSYTSPKVPAILPPRRLPPRLSICRSPQFYGETPQGGDSAKSHRIGALRRSGGRRGRAPNAAAGGIGLQRGFAALLMRFASRNAWRARAPLSGSLLRGQLYFPESACYPAPSSAAAAAFNLPFSPILR